MSQLSNEIQVFAEDTQYNGYYEGTQVRDDYNLRSVGDPVLTHAFPLAFSHSHHRLITGREMTHPSLDVISQNTIT